MQTRQELEQENARFQAELTHIREQLLVHKTAIESKDATINSQESIIHSQGSIIHSKDGLIDQLKEALILARQRQFAKLNESYRSLQSELFDEVEVEASKPEAASDGSACSSDVDVIEVPAHTRKRNGRKPLPAELPRIDVVHDLAEHEKVCAKGNERKLIGEKTSEQLDVIPMKIQVIRHIRKQYACACCEGNIPLAKKPRQAIEKSQASSGLLSYIAVSKYADSLPLYRQSQIFKRFDIDLNRSTLANWMIRCGELVQPLINRLEEQLLSASYLHMDETPVQVLNEAGKRAQSKSYMWIRSGAPLGIQGKNQGQIRLFDYDPSRSSEVPRRLLSGYTPRAATQGALMVDGYQGYEAVCQSQELIRLGCWAHARRKFVEAGKASKKKNTQASYVIKLIGKLYQIEKQLKADTEQERYEQRLERSRPIIDKLRKWLTETLPKVPPKTALGKALYYLDHQWPRLIAYLQDGNYPIDNNPAENAIRPFVVGRKNWLFSNSVAGAKASANLYSLIETAKANSIEPYIYLKRIFDSIPNAQSFDDIDQLLPWMYKHD